MNDMIRIEDLVFKYRRDENQEEVSAIKGVSLAIEKGSFTAIIGRNGSGKESFGQRAFSGKNFGADSGSGRRMGNL